MDDTALVDDTAGRPLLGASSRRWAVVLLAACVFLVAVPGVIFAHHTTANPLDNSVDSPIIAWLGSHVTLIVWLARPGTLVPAAAASAAIVLVCLITRRLNGAILAALAVPIATGLDERLLKPVIHRTYLGQLSYPSGHTTTIFAIAATVTLLLLIRSRSGPTRPLALRALLPAVACLLGLGVATAVIALRWHYFTDTVAGTAVGIGTVCALALVLDLSPVRRLLARTQLRQTFPRKRANLRALQR